MRSKVKVSLAATGAERDNDAVTAVGLQARLDEALQEAEAASRDADTEAETLRAALEASGREVAAATEERRDYGAEMEVRKG